MRYCSTRGGQDGVSFQEVALAGLADDGGLFVPKTIPKIETLEQSARFLDVATAVCRPFVSDSGLDTNLDALLFKAWGAFNSPDIAPITPLYDDLSLLELFHGPSLAFKDFGLRFLAQLYSHYSDGRDGEITIITATSGDTGAAAVSAFAGVKGVRLFVLFPKGRISDVQRKQMTVFDPKFGNVYPLMIDGTFDDCQRIVKQYLGDETRERLPGLTTVNSINWARILGQITYYFWVSHQCAHDEKAPICFVPTGNFGDAFAGYYARQMGARIGPIHCATNENRLLADFLENGRAARGSVIATNSPAMDILVPSNLERLYYYAVGEKSDLVCDFFQSVAQTGAYQSDERSLNYMRNHIDACAVSIDETRHEIIKTYAKSKIVIDPHTAVGVCAANQFEAYGAKKIILATAHPAKFQDTIEDALGLKVEVPARLDYLSDGNEQYTELPADLGTIKEFMVKACQ